MDFSQLEGCSTWMNKCFEQNDFSVKTTISDVWLPGSHDAGTNNLSFNYRKEDIPKELVSLLSSNLSCCVKNCVLNIVRKYAKTQTYSIFELLMYGSRYLDLRPVVIFDKEDRTRKLFISHVLLGKESFVTILKQILKFLKAYEKEFLVLDIYCLRTALKLRVPDDLILIEKEIDSILKEYIVPCHQWKLPLGELLKMNRRVFVIMEKEGLNYSAEHGRSKIRRMWPNEFNVEQLKKKLVKEMLLSVENISSSSRTPIHHVLEFIRSVPEENAALFYTKGILSGIFCCPGCFPTNLTQINRPLIKLGPMWVEEMVNQASDSKRAYVVMMDFVEKENQLLIEKVISMNWRHLKNENQL